MAHRILQVVLILCGILLLIAPTHLSGNGTPGYALGIVFGLALRLMLAALCFWGAYRFGKRARGSRFEGHQ